MTLREKSSEYRESGELCRGRLEELNRRIDGEEMSETERLRLRRKAYVLETMLRETIATSRYLENYYGGKEYDRTKAEYVC